MLTDFQNSFTGRLTVKFATKAYLNTVPHLKCVTTLVVNIERLSSLPPAKSGRACYDNPTGRGYFYQMPNMYTCIAFN